MNDDSQLPSRNTTGSHAAVDVALAGLFRRTREGVEILAARRLETAIRGGLWEFPGGKIEAGETPDRAVVRELWEEVAVDPSGFLSPLHALDVVEHSDPRVERERTVRLHPFLVEVKSTVEPRALGSSEVRWIRVEDFSNYEWPKANSSVNEAILRFFASEKRAADTSIQDPA